MELDGTSNTRSVSLLNTINGVDVSNVGDCQIAGEFEYGGDVKVDTRQLLKFAGTSNSTAKFWAGGAQNESAEGSAESMLISQEGGTLFSRISTPLPNLLPGDKFCSRAEAIGTTYRVKVWEGTPADEPAAWTSEITSGEAYNVSGAIGFFRYWAAQAKVYSIGLGTNGDAAPTSLSSVSVAPSNAPVITGGSITTTDTTVSGDFTFDAAANTGDPVTEYEARVDGGAWRSIGVPDPLSFTVSGLTPNTPYNTPGVEIQALNSGGSGPVSTAIAFTTDAVLATPVNLSSTNVQTTSARLGWEQG
jgi:hypothetical protein